MKASILSISFAGVLWALSAVQVLIVVVRLFTGTVNQTPLIGALLQPGSGAERYVALALLVAFACLLSELARLSVRLFKEYGASNVFDRSAGSFYRVTISDGTMAHRRAALLKDGSSVDGEKLAQLLGGASAVDSSALENMFSFARALTWALPSLGFIGAALGLAQSIGGFSIALKAGDTSKLVASLAQEVIPGLAGSFSITIVALGAATVGHLCATSLLARGHAIVEKLDISSLAIIAKASTTTSPPYQPPYQPAPDLTWLEITLNNLLTEVQSLNSNITEQAQTEEIVSAAEKLEAAGDELKAAAELLADSPLQTTLDNLITEVQALNQNVSREAERQGILDAIKKLEAAADGLTAAADLFVDSIERPYVITIEREKKEKGAHS